MALHGFTLGGAMFEELARLVDGDLVAPDLPGHGGRDGEGCSWPNAVDELGDLVDRHRPDVIVGYSMGGRLLLPVALASELGFTAMFVSSGVGIADPEEKAERRRADDALAQHIEEIGAEEFVAEWESDEQLGGHPHLSDVRRANTTAGIAAALRGLGQGTQPYFGDRLDTMPRPTWWIAGELDPNYMAIAQRATSTAPDATLVVAAAARHNVVADSPEVIATSVRRAIASRRTV